MERGAAVFVLCSHPKRFKLNDHPLLVLATMSISEHDISWLNGMFLEKSRTVGRGEADCWMPLLPTVRTASLRILWPGGGAGEQVILPFLFSADSLWVTTYMVAASGRDK